MPAQALHPSVAVISVSASARFPRSFHSLGMTNYNGVRSVLKGLELKPSVHPYRLVIASEGVAVAWQSPGREDVVSYTIPLQPSARPDCHVISSVSREISLERNETKRTRTKNLSAGDFSTAFGLRPHSGRNDIIKPNGRSKHAPTYRSKRHRNPPRCCHCERRRSRSVAISRKGTWTLRNSKLPTNAYSRKKRCPRTLAG